MKKKSLHLHTIIIIMMFFLSTAGSVYSQYPIDPTETYDKIEVRIPMRDGIRLHKEIYVPKSFSEPLPFLMLRTPYGLPQSPYGYYWRMGGSLMWNKHLIEKYIFVFQDIRGRYKSEGEFAMIRPPNPGGIDESTDTYDTIEWLLNNIEGNNGKVGIQGVSYDGWLAAMTLINPHPALKAVSPQGSPSDMFMGDDFYHNGAFRLSPGFGYAAMMELSDNCTPFNFNKDTYDWFLELGALYNVNEYYLHENSPTWNDFINHPNYDEFWQSRELTQYFGQVNIAILNVAGWWDAEDFYGSMHIYEAIEAYDTQNLNYLIVGPWRHGGWQVESSSLYDIDFESATGTYFMENTPGWFAYYLKDKRHHNLPDVLTFQTGSNEWKSYEEWPPKDNIEERALYLHSNGRLSFEQPQDNDFNGFDDYISDPADPVPFTKRPITGFWQGDQRRYYKVEDQRFVSERPDVLYWQTDVLEADITVAGKLIVNLFASTSGTDCDWIVKLIDVYPENHPDENMRGYQLMIADEVFRSKFRNSFQTPTPLTSGEITEFAIDLNSRNHCFLAGHRIMIQVQSTWFPLIDRNPQTFVNIMVATENDYQSATQRVYRSENYSSHIVLPVVTPASYIHDDKIRYIPESFSLDQNFPNPFNAQTTISYQVPESKHVVLKIYDISGQGIRILKDEVQEAGKYSITWDGTDDESRFVATGIYMIGLKIGENVAIKKMLMIK